MSQRIEDVNYLTTTIDGKEFWYAETENKGFQTFAFETKEMCQLAVALFYASGCSINEFQNLIGPTFRMWKIKSKWSE